MPKSTTSFLLLGFILLSSSSVFGQNKLDIVATAIERGHYQSALEELEMVKKTAKAALPPRAFKYEFDISAYFLQNAENRLDSTKWSERMQQVYVAANNLGVSNEFQPEMLTTLQELHAHYRRLASGYLLANNAKSFLEYNTRYINSGLTVSEPLKQHIYQSAEYAKSIDSLGIAINYYQLAIKQDFEVQLSYANWISLLRVQRNRESADSVLALATAEFPESNIKQLVTALENYDKKLYFTALKEVQASLETDTENPTLHYLMGMINLKTDRVDAAIDGFHRVEELAKESYMTNYQLGKYYMNEGISKKDSGALSVAGFSLSQCESMQKNDLFLYQTILTFCEAIKDEKNGKRVRAVMMR